MKNAKTTAKAATAKNATVAKPKTEKQAAAPKPAVGKYGAPAVRPNRADKAARSVMGDRKWIFRGVTEIDQKTLAVKATDSVNSTPFPKETAEKVLAHALKNGAINGRLYYKKTVDGVEMRGVYIALPEDNGQIQKTA